MDGATLEGQKIALRITLQNAAALIESLDESGIPGLNEYIQALSTIGNLADGTDYRSLSELFASMDAGDFSLPMIITAAGAIA